MGQLIPFERISRAALTLVLGVSVTWAASVHAAPAGSAAVDAPTIHSLGAATAPVTVIEYASVGCPHCATWANDTFPGFKAQYLDTGKARFEFHEMLTGDMDLAAAGFLLANCAAPDKYFQVVDAIFADQVGILRGGGAALLKVAQDAGMTRDQFQACLTDEAALKSLEDRTEHDAQDHGVVATPTFMIGDQKLNGELNIDALGAAIARARH
jgi:protein-disulfide isomerase